MGRFTAFVIVFTIKLCFFISVNSYSLGQKPYTSLFFSFLEEKIMKVVYAILAAAMKDFQMRLNNKNLSIRKSAI